MDPTDSFHIAGKQMELALPPIAVEAVVIERMAAVIAENRLNVALCGNTILMLQKQVEAVANKVRGVA